MHSAALTAGGEVFTTGVNDEGALGRRTGAPPRRGCSAAPLGRPRMPCRVAGPVLQPAGGAVRPVWRAA